MNIINIKDRIRETLANLNRESGGGAECAVEVDGHGRPYLRTCSWSGNRRDGDDGMVLVCEYDADRAAETIGLNTDLSYAWCDGEGGTPTLAAFDSVNERDTLLGQI